MFVAGAGLASGYLNDPEKTEERFRDDVLVETLKNNGNATTQGEKMFAGLAFQIQISGEMKCIFRGSNSSNFRRPVLGGIDADFSE